MIRDPSDGTVKPVAGIPTADVRDENAMTDMVERIVGILSEGDTEADLEEYAKLARLVIEAMREPTARLEESRKWLKNYVHSTIIEKGQ